MPHSCLHRGQYVNINQLTPGEMDRSNEVNMQTLGTVLYCSKFIGPWTV